MDKEKQNIEKVSLKCFSSIKHNHDTEDVLPHKEYCMSSIIECIKKIASLNMLTLFMALTRIAYAKLQK